MSHFAAKKRVKIVAECHCLQKKVLWGQEKSKKAQVFAACRHIFPKCFLLRIFAA